MERSEEYFIFSYVLVKVMLAGDHSVGKTSLLYRYVKDTFDKPLTSIGADFMTKYLNIDDTNVKLQIWDLTGGERFKSIMGTYFRGADGVIFVFDKTYINSFENIPSWLELANKVTGNPKILVGNKADDIEHFQVDFSVANQLANDFKINYIETSALNSFQVNLAFETICRQALAHKLATRETTVFLPNQKSKLNECF